MKNKKILLVFDILILIFYLGNFGYNYYVNVSNYQELILSNSI